jgi:hypothetical protein
MYYSYKNLIKTLAGTGMTGTAGAAKCIKIAPLI